MEDSQGVPLYRRGGALTLVREFLLRDERGGIPCSRPTPVVVFTGAGLSAPLAELARRLNQNAPLALIDCEDFTGGARALPAGRALPPQRPHGPPHPGQPLPRLVTPPVP